MPGVHTDTDGNPRWNNTAAADSDRDTDSGGHHNLHGELRWSDRTGVAGRMGRIESDRWRWSDVYHLD